MLRTKSWTERLYSLFFDTLTADLSRLKTDGNSNVVSAENSSTTPLGIAGVFTGTWVDVSAYPELMVAVTADADGSYAIQFSPDGTNIDSTLTRYYRTGQINAPHRFTVTRSYFRVVFTNGSVAQTVFRLQTLLGVFGELNAPTDGTLRETLTPPLYDQRCRMTKLFWDADKVFRPISSSDTMKTWPLERLNSLRLLVGSSPF